ncbi:MAG: IS1182 family transposase [Anaerolineaceae bacterium]|nr:IS1182 family transposase [Anaerolineaceae bacterium]
MQILIELVASQRYSVGIQSERMPAMGFISANRSQSHLFGYSLDDFVEPDSKCRHIVRWVERLDMTAIYADYSNQGGDAFDPRLMLATWFFAYSEGVTSTRKLEQLCRRDMHFIFVSAHLQPDHTSLSRFRQRHGRRLPDLFVQIVRHAAEDGVSDFGLIAVDGTKVEAQASHKQNRTGQKLSKQLGAIRAKIQEYLERCELLDEPAESESVDHIHKRIEQLQAMEQKLLSRQETLEARKKTLQSKDRAKHKINLTEPEARNMKAVNGKTAAPGYNAQVSVDTDSRLIVAADVSDAPTDQQQFRRQHQNVESNLPENDDRAYVADAGYNCLEQLEYIEQQAVDVVLADPRPEHRSGGKARSAKRYTRSMFEYDAARDDYRCSAGQRLAYWYTDHRDGRSQRVYRCRACEGCSHRKPCLGVKRKTLQRTVRRDARECLAEAMSGKSQTERGLACLAVRRQTVEPVIGNLKANLGFRRFCLRGLAAVRGEFALMCIAHNLNRLIALVQRDNGLDWLAYLAWRWSQKGLGRLRAAVLAPPAFLVLPAA